MPAASITLAFADGEYVFRLGLAQIDEIERKCGAGIGAICARLFKGRYKLNGQPLGLAAEADFRVADLIEPIRQGLIGGGEGLVDGQPVKVGPPLANVLIENYVIGCPLHDSWTLAAAVMMALMEGYTPPKKAEPPVAAAPAANPRKKRGSTSPGPSSTAP